MEFTFLQILWFFLIFLLIAGYFILDGFDLGVGVLYPFVAKDDLLSSAWSGCVHPGCTKLHTVHDLVYDQSRAPDLSRMGCEIEDPTASPSAWCDVFWFSGSMLFL